VTAVYVASALCFPACWCCWLWRVRARLRWAALRVVLVRQLGQILLVLLFAISAATLDLDLVPAGALAGAVLVAARYVGKTVGVFALAPASGLSMRKASLLSLTLMPMSGVALILVHDMSALFPGLGSTPRASWYLAIVMLGSAGACGGLLRGWCARASGQTGGLNLETIASPSAPLSLGGTELQLVNTRDCDLTRAASTCSLIEKEPHAGDIKPEITESMIEVSTGIHGRHDTLLAELREIRATVVAAADRLNVRVAGGGAHPFQHWSDRRIFDRPRFKNISQLYGYLAKQFTVFGQHIHVGCPDGDDALYLLHAISRYLPQFIALSASSPYYQGVDTAFDSSRLNAVFAFPLSGRAPFSLKWSEFTSYVGRMTASGIVESMKDFYWDVRPKPEFGTIEVGSAIRRSPSSAPPPRRLCAGALPLAHVERPTDLRRQLPRLHLQPVPGMPLRPGRRSHRSGCGRAPHDRRGRRGDAASGVGACARARLRGAAAASRRHRARWQRCALDARSVRRRRIARRPRLATRGALPARGRKEVPLKIGLSARLMHNPPKELDFAARRCNTSKHRSRTG
jgi:carboxylate-amine ligase